MARISVLLYPSIVHDESNVFNPFASTSETRFSYTHERLGRPVVP
jgi:hypothetical protein